MFRRQGLPVRSDARGLRNGLMLNVREEDIDKITEAFYLILKGKKGAWH